MRNRWVAVAAVAALVIVSWVAAMAVVRTAPPPRNVTLVVKDMRFYLPGSDVPNPPIRVRPGETVKVVLVNEERGMLHDVAVPALGFAIEPFKGGDGARASGLLEAPEEPGRHEYVCTLHLLTMRGVLEVAP